MRFIFCCSALLHVHSTCLLIAISSLAVFENRLDAAEPQRPNILLIVTDDQAPWAMGHAVRNGQFTDVPVAHTPHMDQLARQGAVFQNFFSTSPVCSPARASMMTGHYASELGIDDFIPSPEHKLFDPEYQVAMDPTTTTFAEVFQDNGYHTGLIGKWHLGDWTLEGNERFHPTQQGFDSFMGLTSGGITPQNPLLEKGKQVQRFKGLTTDILTDHAIEFIENATLRPDPFLLCFHTRAPHGAWLPVAPEDWEPYADLDPAIPHYSGLATAKVKKMMREYLASTTGVDRNIGRLLDVLEHLQISRNTIVIFTSDHGYNMGHNGIWHKGNGIWATKKTPPGTTHQGTEVISNKYRPNMYDLSLKVPALVRWPDVVKPGTVIQDSATSLDLFPTLLQMAGIKETQELNLHGRNLSQLLQDKAVQGWDQEIYAEYSMIHYAVAKMRCYRTPQYKLIRDFHNSNRDEFYDLQTDPAESNNLIRDESPEIQKMIARLNEKLISKMKSIHDPLLDSSNHGGQR